MIREIPVPQEFETIVEKVVEKRVSVPGPVKYVEKIVEVEKVVEVERPIWKVREIPVPYPVEKVVEKVTAVSSYAIFPLVVCAFLPLVNKPIRYELDVKPRSRSVGPRGSGWPLRFTFSVSTCSLSTNPRNKC